jgi:hypothetical protein
MAEKDDEQRALNIVFYFIRTGKNYLDDPHLTTIAVAAALLLLLPNQSLSWLLPLSNPATSVMVHCLLSSGR